MHLYPTAILSTNTLTTTRFSQTLIRFGGLTDKAALTIDAATVKPQLDATYGSNAITAYQSLLTSFPDSPFAPKAREELAKLDAWLAEKDYDTGYLYLKRKAYDSAIIYFKDVIRLHPNAPKTRDAYLRLLEAYRAIRYTEDARDLCAEMRTKYPNNRQIREECGPPPPSPSPATPATPPPTP